MDQEIAIGNLLAEHPLVTVIGISKNKSAEAITGLYAQGLRDFGENYVQEFLAKYDSLKHLPLRWHFVGSLQTNKVKYIIDKIDCLHSLCSLTVAEEIQKRSAKLGHKLSVLLQVNLAAESAKSGLTPEEAPAFLDKLRDYDRLEPVGLMAIPPLLDKPEQLRPYFRQLRELRDLLKLKELSMGMSHDYQVAIEEGATMIRLGTLLFGERS